MRGQRCVLPLDQYTLLLVAQYTHSVFLAHSSVYSLSILCSQLSILTQYSLLTIQYICTHSVFFAHSSVYSSHSSVYSARALYTHSVYSPFLQIFCATPINQAVFLSDCMSAITVNKEDSLMAGQTSSQPDETSMSLVWICTGTEQLTKVGFN